MEPATIASLPTSRALDALVAEKVFGKRVEWSRQTGMLDEPYYPAHDDRFFGTIHVPPYSTSIAAAWDVVEKLRGKIEEIHFLSNGIIEIIGWDGANEGYAFAVVADTAPLAICRAALKAVGA